MACIILRGDQTPERKLEIMADLARFDVSEEDSLPLGGTAGVPRRDLAAPKVFLSNDCAFDCAYCACRSSRDARRYAHEPGDMARIAAWAAQESGRGVFLTSAVRGSPDRTQELIVETLRLLRGEYGYRGFVHAKVMPGADLDLIYRTGMLADRVSVNVELARSEGYPLIARQKSKAAILGPMARIRRMICESERGKGEKARRIFAPAGQTTQIVAGAMGETDRELMMLAESLYAKFGLKRVYYSPFRPVQAFERLPSVPTPRWRARRLYQADSLVRLYGFPAGELAPKDRPDLDFDIDPKAAWALRNLGMFPVEVNGADYETLLRVPGIGVASARRIIRERRRGPLACDTLPRLGVPLGKARFFITCGGRHAGADILGKAYLRDILADRPEQMSLFSLDADEL